MCDHHCRVETEGPAIDLRERAMTVPGPVSRRSAEFGAGSAAQERVGKDLKRALANSDVKDFDLPNYGSRHVPVEHERSEGHVEPESKANVPTTFVEIPTTEAPEIEPGKEPEEAAIEVAQTDVSSRVNEVLMDINERATALPSGQGPSKRNARKLLQAEGLQRLAGELNVSTPGDVLNYRASILSAVQALNSKYQDAARVLSFLKNPEAWKK